MPKVAAIQMCSSHILDENLQMAETLMQEASKNHAKLIVLPEMFSLIGMHETDKLNIQENEGHGKIQAFLSKQAKNNKVWIVGGTTPLHCEEKNKAKSSCLVLDDQGNKVARYDKIHLFDVTISEKEIYKESDTVSAGNHVITISTPFGTLGLAVCYDLRFPELFRHLFKQGAEIIAIPAAFTMKTGQAHWEILMRARAIENFCYVIGAAQGGTHTSGRQTYGHSLIVDPWGTIQAEKRTPGNGVIYADIDLNYLHHIRKLIPVAEHQKL